MVTEIAQRQTTESWFEALGIAFAIWCLLFGLTGLASVYVDGFTTVTFTLKSIPITLSTVGWLYTFAFITGIPSLVFLARWVKMSIDDLNYELDDKNTNPDTEYKFSDYTLE